MTYEVDCRFDGRECVLEDSPDGRRTCRNMNALNEARPPPDYDVAEKQLPQRGIPYSENRWWPQWCDDRLRMRK